MTPKPVEPPPEYETATVEQPEDAAMPLGLPRRRLGKKPAPPLVEDESADSG